MNTYRIYIRSNEHPRTINTPMMGRTYYSIIEVKGVRADLVAKVEELRAKGEFITDIYVGCGHKIYL